MLAQGETLVKRAVNPVCALKERLNETPFQGIPGAQSMLPRVSPRASMNRTVGAGENFTALLSWSERDLE